MASRRKVALMAALCAILVIGGLVGMAFGKQFARPTIKQEPDILTQGDVARSKQIFQALFTDLRAHNFDARKVAVQNYRLPDQDLAEYAPAREKDLVDIFMPDSSTPEYGDIAFYTDIYVKLNVRRLAGDKAECNPEGFYLVAWKNGTVSQVPVGAVRMITRPKVNHYQTYLPVFPGMKAYRDSLPALPYWAAAKNKPSALP